MNLVGYPQAANYLKLSLNSLYWRVSRGEIPHVRLGPRTVRFDLEELNRWLSERSVGGGDRGC